MTGWRCTPAIPTSWWLGGTSNSQYDAGVHGRARCIIYPPIGPQQPYTYTGWVNANSEKILQPTSWKCYLAGIRGVFEGSRSVAIIFRGQGLLEIDHDEARDCGG
jgi:hypothetical protein